MKHASTFVILLILCCLAHAGELARSPVEEVVAVVDRTPLLASDIVLMDLLDVVELPADESDSNHRQALLDARIRLEVQFRDLEVSGVIYRLDLDVATTRRSLLDRVGGVEAIAPAMAAAGLSKVDIDELALRISAANAFAEQRLRPRVSVGMAEIESAYRSLVAELESAGQPAPPLVAVHEQLHRLVAERKLNDEIERWVARAFAEREVTRFAS